MISLHRSICRKVGLPVTGAAVALLVVGCQATEPVPSDLTITLAVEGGFAPRDYAISIEPATGHVTGVRCVSWCEFEDGQVLARLTAAQVDLILAEVMRTGLRESGRDYGNECCDQISYALTWVEPGRVHTVRGSTGTLPETVLTAAKTLESLASAILPVVVDFDARPADLPEDPLDIRSVEIANEILTATVVYSGGCVEHAFALVAWNGWLESNPVQVGAVLAHNAFDDACDAVITRPVRFDLAPLRLAYREAYGTAPPGTTVLRIQVSEPGPAGDTVTVDYTF